MTALISRPPGLPEQRDRLQRLPSRGVPGEHRRPGDDVPVARGVEHRPRGGGVSGGRVGVDDGGGDVDVSAMAGLGELRVEAPQRSAGARWGVWANALRAKGNV